MSSIFTFTALYVAGAVFALDFVWARYNIATAEKHVLSSSVYSVMVYLLSAVVVMEYISNPWLLLPASVGAFAGTAFSVWTEKRGNS